MALGLLVTLGIWVRPALIGAFVPYLSFVYARQVFTNFQWDLLLLEAGFLAIFLTSGSRIIVWLYRWLVFRFLFLAGAMKLLSGDPTWRSLTALDYHFWTQPLPTPLAWYAAQLPDAVLVAATAAVLAIELGLDSHLAPRAVAAWAVLLFQLVILLTGNYGFFNLLTMLLCLFLFDDAALRRLVPARLVSSVENRAPRPGHAATAETVSPLLIANPYGLFVTTTTTRPEIIIEGSQDGQTWREYVFRYKPGPVTRRPPWNIPHQPRLDWQMWFAAYRSVAENGWFDSLMKELLNGSPPVLALLAANPFPDRPPKYVRAQLYDYRFADPGTPVRTGQWWVRQLEGLYFPQVSLADFSSAVSREMAPSLPGMPPGQR